METGGRFDGQANLPLPKSRNDVTLHKTQTLQTKAKADQARLTLSLVDLTTHVTSVHMYSFISEPKNPTVQ